MEDLIPLLSAVITTLGTVFAAMWGRHYWRARKIDPVVDDTAQSSNIYMALDYIMEQMEADRAYVLQFHNGGYYYSGRSQQKFSCTHESTSRGVSRECSTSQEHRISHYHNYIDSLIRNGKFCYQDIENMDDHNFIELLQEAGVKSIYNVPIKTLNGRIIGILGVDYVKAQMKCDVENETSLQFMKRQARIVSGYLL